ncbi:MULTISPECIES: DUF4924 family protein [unclassified Dysgonomonas]|uniref:DUF4924 family protein n=1 Tax=unclassified Dysgonomonas TaxID=2630389 RepID=UPI00068113B9|nr:MULTISPECIES: DUF4924 family protein [unclassified Dysgonomonas]MBD8349527.1 DUF4924 family protein [Dysgonomonas sp. HGC4]MBF0577872.1 DUF4924 family protein [Dysgonomonas sp. GY617]
MLIAKQKKNENIAEYLLYMWQIEDILRANKLDIDVIEESIINKFDQTDDIKKEIKDWYEGLIEMMKLEGITEKGHLQINKNVIIDLTDLHLRLLKSPKEPEYISNYYKTLPFIVELRAKSEDKSTPELETCFSALYGFLLLRLQQKEISGETQAAISQISSFLRMLSNRYHLDKEGKLEI